MGRVVGARANRGLTALARSRKSWTDSKPASAVGASASAGRGQESVCTRQRVSPAVASGSRLVARMVRRGQPVSSVVARRAQASTRCSQLSRISKTAFGASWSTSVSTIGRSCCSRTPIVEATTRGTRSGSETAASSTNQTPSGYASSASAATCNASRVLPVPPVPVKRDETMRAEQAAHVVQLLLAADEAGELEREIVRAGVERLERWELGGEIVAVELEDALRPGQVAQAMLAEVDERHAVRQVVRDERRRRLGEQGLAADGDPTDPCAAVDGRAVVVVVAQLGLAGVEADADLDRARRRPGLGGEGALDREGGGHGAGRGGEDGETAVTFATGADVLAVVLANGVLEEEIVAGKGRAHRLRERFPERGTAFDVGEEERHRPTRERRACA